MLEAPVGTEAMLCFAPIRVLPPLLLTAKQTQDPASTEHVTLALLADQEEDPVSPHCLQWAHRSMHPPLAMPSHPVLPPCPRQPFYKLVWKSNLN